MRTYHTGATRKRILPIDLDLGDASAPPPGSDITFHPAPSSASKKPKSAGKLLSTLPNNPSQGFALVRLEMAERACWNSVEPEDQARLTVSHEGQEFDVFASQGKAFLYAIEQQRKDDLAKQQQ